MSLFIKKNFISHAGLALDWKIECDNLTDEDLETLAYVAGKMFCFQNVVGIPRGGLRFAEKLRPYCRPLPHLPTVVVDDVLTTGISMKEMLAKYPNSFGLVIFNRGKMDFCQSLFQLNTTPY